MSDYFVYFKTAEGDFRVYSTETEELSTVQNLPRDCRKFEMLKHEDLKANDEDLLRYVKLFKKWCKQLKEDRYCNIDYADKYCNFAAVSTNYNRRSFKHYKHHEKITTTEWKWFEKCFNSGLQYLSEPDITKHCYSYDFKQQYPRCMNSDNMIPTKSGTECTIKALRKHLKPGFYHVRITCDNDNFRKIFAFSKHNVYIMESLAYAIKHADQFDVEIELIVDGKPNAYLYDPDDMVSLKSINGEWYDFMVRTKSKYPKNRLVKHMFSSCWATMNAHTKVYKTWEQIEKEKLNVGYAGGSKQYDYEILEHRVNGEKEVFSLLDTSRPYTSNIRLKPWISALARNLTGDMVLQDIKRVVRVQTDSVSYTREQEFEDEGFVAEDKTTGKIHFRNVNTYKNLTTGYTTGGYKE